MAPFTYDQNNPQALADYWFEQVGDLYVGRKYNGFGLLNERREIIDIFIVDVDGEIPGRPGSDDGWEVVIERIASHPDTTDVIAFHGHTSHDPSGPCPGLEQFAGDAILELGTRAGVTFRFVLVLRDREIDGCLAAALPEPIMEAVLRNDLATANMLGMAMETPDPVELAQEMVDRGALMFFADSPTIQSIIADSAAGLTPSTETLEQGLRELAERTNNPLLADLAREAAAQVRKTLPTAAQSLFDLPMARPNERLN